MLLTDDGERVVIKVMCTASRECRVLEQLLGMSPAPGVARLGLGVRAGGAELWRTLRLVPLPEGSLVRLDGQPDVSALVMRKLQPLSHLSHLTRDARILLRVVSQLVEVRRAHR